MSLDTAMPAANASMFAALGRDATVQRDTGTPQSVRVVVFDGEETLGPRGERIGNARHLQFIKSIWDPQRGDLVTIDDTAQRVGQIVSDDGYVVEVVVRG